MHSIFFDRHRRKIKYCLPSLSMKKLLSIVSALVRQPVAFPGRRRAAARLVVRIATQHRTIRCVCEHLFKLTGYFHMHMCASVTHARTHIIQFTNTFALRMAAAFISLNLSKIQLDNRYNSLVNAILFAARCRMLSRLLRYKTRFLLLLSALRKLITTWFVIVVM